MSVVAKKEPREREEEPGNKNSQGVASESSRPARPLEEYTLDAGDDGGGVVGMG